MIRINLDLPTSHEWKNNKPQLGKNSNNVQTEAPNDFRLETQEDQHLMKLNQQDI